VLQQRGFRPTKSSVRRNRAKTSPKVASSSTSELTHTSSGLQASSFSVNWMLPSSLLRRATFTAAQDSGLPTQGIKHAPSQLVHLVDQYHCLLVESPARADLCILFIRWSTIPFEYWRITISLCGNSRSLSVAVR